ncbi:MAG: hypothetical protein HYX22_00795 [Candidatus Yanofskybacteria bacterium]|nr:hypothetical protein [Candidatus Yanofskybacteria bacterium]
MIQHFQRLIFVLLFGLLAVFLVHNFDSIGQDIGRHLKTGEIIWQTKSVPTTNLFSYTEPDFPFTNHHWLSEVIFYGVYNLGGFGGLIWLKIFVILATFLLLFLTIKHLWINDLRSRLSTGKRIGFWPVFVSFLLSIFIFISRTEVRPEIFSFFILSFFLFALFKAKYGGDGTGRSVGNDGNDGSVRNDNSNKRSDPTSEAIQQLQQAKRSNASNNLLWFLPLAQLLWVNLHIYFFIGPLIFLFFLIDRAVNKKIVGSDGDVRDVRNENTNLSSEAVQHLHQAKRSNSSNILWIFILVVLATLINPAGIQGALLPFNILKEYGYSIVENQTLAFLADFFGFNLSIFIFKISVAIAAVLVLLNIKKARERFFEIAILAFFIFAGFKMLRNLPLYALVSFPVMAVLFTDAMGTINNLQFTINNRRTTISNIFKTAVAGFLVFMIFFVASGGYYKWTRLSKTFGFSVPDGLRQATDFVKENNIEGPMFNNFDIGGYLIWQIEGVRYPAEKVPDPFRVFVDNRPEAYSAEFFSEVYKPMQAEPEKWKEFSEKYGINFIFFGHTDATPWGQAFLQNIVRNPEWKVVFINESAIILVKNNEKNRPVFSKYKYELTE